jgi:hypothetical protein
VQPHLLIAMITLLLLLVFSIFQEAKALGFSIRKAMRNISKISSWKNKGQERYIALYLIQI